MKRVLLPFFALVVAFFPGLALCQDTDTAVVRTDIDLMSATTSAATTFFTANLAGDQQNPALDVPGRGAASFVLDADGLRFRITVSDLSGPMTAAHFHLAAAGTNGGVVHGITGDFDGNTAEGVWSSDGLTHELIGDLLAGRIYVNINTSANPGGEIRGQVILASGIGFTARLSGDNEVPDRDVDGSGTGAFVLNGPVTGSHFHQAAAGSNGGVVRAFTAESTSASGVWTLADSQPLTAELIGDLLAGRIYVNFHTAEFPAGELRGQLKLVSGVRAVVSLTGDQVVPSQEGDAAGTAVVTFDGASVGYRITASGLTGPVVNAHFHGAEAGVNGGVVHGIFGNFNGNTGAGVWTAADSQSLTAELIQDLLAGNLYINLHTAENPGGEIRGQVVFSTGLVFQASLSGQNHTPAVETDGTGTGGFVWDGDALSYRVTVDGLSAPASNAHFHQAAAGANGGVVREIFSSFANGTTQGSWTSDDAQPLSSSLMTDLMEAGLYVNVHTSAHPGGELRGQVVQPSPTLAGLVVSLSRSISGRANAFQWSAATDANGTAEVTVTAGDDFRFRRSGPGGYYIVLLSEPGGRTIGEWTSIPVRRGQTTHLELPVMQRANVTGFTALQAARPAVVVDRSPTRVSAASSPILSFGTTTSTGERVILPITFGPNQGIAGADIQLRYDSDAVRFDSVEPSTPGMTVTETVPGMVNISIDGEPVGDLELAFVSRGGEVPAYVFLEAVLLSSDLFASVEDLATMLDLGRPAFAALHLNYPNPFNPETHIPYDLAEPGHVVVQIYNVTGQRVARLVDEQHAAGRYRVTWDASNHASGFYYVELTTHNFRNVRRMMLIK